MRVRNEFYIVYDQDVEGNDRTPYYFYDVRDACYFAVINEGRMAYHLPTIVKIVQSYDTYDMSFRKSDKCYYELSESEIRHYAKGFVK